MARDYFCIDIGESYIKVADIHKNGAFFEADSLGMVETDPLIFHADTESTIQNQAQIIAKLVSQLNINKKSVNVIIPDTYSYSRFVQMPKLNEKELLSAIKYQADQFIPMAIEETNIDIEIIREDAAAKQLYALIAAAPKKLVSKIERLITSAGLIPASIETEISAVGRLSSSIFKATKPDPAAPSKPGVLIVNMSLNSTSLYFFDQTTGFITFNHNFNIGLNLFLKELQVNLNLEYEKALKLLGEVGISASASYNLEPILAPVMKDFMVEIQHTLSVLNDKSQASLKGIYFFNDALKFHEIHTLIGKYLGITPYFLDLYPFFTQNPTAGYFKDKMGYFVSSIGGNLK